MSAPFQTLAHPLTVQALIFDIDGTLILSDIPSRRMWRGWAEKHGLDFEAVLKASAGKRTVDTVREFCPPGVSADDEARQLEQQEVSDLEGIAPVPGVVAFLQSLPRERWAVATSSGPAMARARLRAAGIEPPERMITGLDVAAGKPDPAVFVKAAEALGFAPEHTVVFEDAAVGVEAARQAGARVILVATGNDPGLAADQALDGYRVDDYTRLRVARDDRQGLTLSGS